MTRILILGGYGVFGGRLARRLARIDRVEVLVAGRSQPQAEAHCARYGGTPLVLDRDGDLETAFRALSPAVVVDAAGPFQAYGDDPYRVAQAAMAAGAHYVDLADDAAFVAGIGALDVPAKRAGVTVISGASSIPAISAAALDELTAGFRTVSVVGSAIVPGNQTPRGLSVVRAILAQAGQPVRIWRGGRWHEQPVWGDVKRISLKVEGAAPVEDRLCSPIGAPDLLLFPQRYGARSALFRAGLELKFLHVGLWLLAWLVRFRLIASMAPLASMLKWIADRLERFGSSRGGMSVHAIGRDADGKSTKRSWTLIADNGDGPEIPPTPALLIALKLAKGEALPHGAYPACGALSLADIEAGLAEFSIVFGRDEKPSPPLMEQVLSKDFADLPPAWQRLADIHDIDHFDGTASVERGVSFGSRTVAALFGFPPAADQVAVSVTKQRTARGETWTRRFAGKPFVSYLSRQEGDGLGMLRERFGPFSFGLRLRAEAGTVFWPVESWRLLGVPMPRAWAPESRTSEFVDGEGRFRFDVAISLPLIGRIVRDRGWLAPAH